MSVNFSNSTPAATAGNRLATVQTDGSGNFSIQVPVSATELIPLNVDLTGQSADITATNLVATPSAGLYRITAYIVVVTPDGTSSTLPSVVITWADQDNSASQSFTLTPTNPGDSQTTFQQNDCLVSVATSSPIQFSTSGYASNTSAKMKFALHIRIEEI